MARITWKKLGMAAVRAYRRAISYFNGSTSYAEFTDDIVLDGAFYFSFDVNVSVVQSQVYLADSGSAFFRNDANGLFVFRDDGAHQYQMSATQDTGWRRIGVEYDGSDIIAFIDGVEINRITPSTWTTFTIRQIGRRGSGFQYLNGNIKNLEIWTGGDRTTGTQIVNMPMGEYRKDLDDRLVYHNYAQSDDWYLNFINTAVETNHVYDIDAVDNSFSVEFRVSELVDGTIVSQTIGASFTDKELQLFFGGNGAVLICILGGNRSLSISVPAVGFNDVLRFEYNGSDTITLYINDVAVGSTPLAAGAIREPSAPFRVGARGAGGTSIGYVWGSGLKDLVFTQSINTTPIELVNMRINDFSSVVTNTANPLGANVWDDDGVTTVGESQIISDGVYRIYSSAGDYSAVRFSDAAFNNKEFYTEVEVVSGDINSLVTMDTTTQFTGWECVRDSLGQPVPNKFKTLSSTMLSGFVQIKRKVGATDVTIKNVTFREAIDYGVLNGTEGTDYEWKNAAPEAIGYNITTERVD